jgi:hypothetical protein
MIMPNKLVCYGLVDGQMPGSTLLANGSLGPVEAKNSLTGRDYDVLSRLLHGAN